jgi:hypothetical protein
VVVEGIFVSLKSFLLLFLLPFFARAKKIEKI